MKLDRNLNSDLLILCPLIFSTSLHLVTDNVHNPEAIKITDLSCSKTIILSVFRRNMHVKLLRVLSFLVHIEMITS